MKTGHTFDVHIANLHSLLALESSQIALGKLNSFSEMLFWRRSEPDHGPRQAAWPAVPPSLCHGPFKVDEGKPAAVQPSDQPHYNPGKQFLDTINPLLKTEIFQLWPVA